MSYQKQLNQDRIFGKLNEERIMPIIEKKFDIILNKIESRFATFDFFDNTKNVFVEVKGNKSLFGDYMSAMIGYNKIRASIGKLKDNKRVILVFTYKDSDYFHEVSKDIDYKQYCEIRTRSDRGREEISTYCLIPNKMLTIL